MVNFSKNPIDVLFDIFDYTDIPNKDYEKLLKLRDYCEKLVELNEFI